MISPQDIRENVYYYMPTGAWLHAAYSPDLYVFTVEGDGPGDTWSSSLAWVELVAFLVDRGDFDD